MAVLIVAPVNALHDPGPGPSDLRMLVVDSASGTPIREAFVIGPPAVPEVASQGFNGCMGTRVLRTDHSGRVVFSRVGSAGVRIVLSVDHPHYPPLLVQKTIPAEGDFDLTLELVRGLDLMGRVVDPTGLPWTFGFVDCARSSTGVLPHDPFRRAPVGRDGRFLVTGLPRDEALVLSFTRGPDELFATSCLLPRDLERESWIVPHARDLVGRIRRVDGSAVGAFASVKAVPELLAGERRAAVDPSGAYRFAQMCEGTYRIEAADNGRGATSWQTTRWDAAAPNSLDMLLPGIAAPDDHDARATTLVFPPREPQHASLPDGFDVFSSGTATTGATFRGQSLGLRVRVLLPPGEYSLRASRPAWPRVHTSFRVPEQGPGPVVAVPFERIRR